MFTHFEQGDLLSETCNNTEIVNKYNDDLTLPPLFSEEKMDTMSSGDESDADSIYTNMLEDIFDDSQSHNSINRIEARYKICDCIKRGQAKWEGALKDM